MFITCEAYSLWHSALCHIFVFFLSLAKFLLVDLDQFGLGDITHSKVSKNKEINESISLKVNKSMLYFHVMR